MAAAAPELNHKGVYLESKRIIKANFRHFLTLSAIFLFPLISFSLFIYPIPQLLQSSTPPIIINPLQIKTLALPLIYSLFVFVLTISAVGTITYSTHHGGFNNGRPVKLVSSIKSLFQTFIPLAATTLVSQTIVILIAVAFTLFVGLVSRSAAIHELLLLIVLYHDDGNNIIDDHKYSDYFVTWFRAVVLIICVVVVLYIQVNWSLASVIVVVESKWGFQALRRSKYLVRGMRWVSLSIISICGYVIWFSVWLGSQGLGNLVNTGSYCWKIFWVLQILLCVFLFALYMRNYMVTFAVLYMHCKVKHGELDWEINADESATKEYVSLPFDDDDDDDKVPLLVSVAHP